ncbi:MAG TPA: hypothetical protein VM487_07445, partial [Phycisphaerae bacterium]|nr:hypothetical protein [Phycisphaerae bacterium]HUU95557.1 hypothetical protein [Phycisphaerae bacterium]
VGPEDDISTMKEVIDLTAGALFDGDTRFMPYPAGYETPARITLKHNTPLPCTVVATMPQLVVQDR